MRPLKAFLAPWPLTVVMPLALVACAYLLVAPLEARPRLFGRGACANGSCAVAVPVATRAAYVAPVELAAPPKPTLDNDAIGPMPTVEAAVVIDNTAIATAVHFGGPFARVAGLARRPVAAVKKVGKVAVRAPAKAVRRVAKIVKARPMRRVLGRLRRR